MIFMRYYPRAQYYIILHGLQLRFEILSTPFRVFDFDIRIREIIIKCQEKVLAVRSGKK